VGPSGSRATILLFLTRGLVAIIGRVRLPSNDTRVSIRNTRTDKNEQRLPTLLVTTLKERRPSSWLKTTT